MTKRCICLIRVLHEERTYFQDQNLMRMRSIVTFCLIFLSVSLDAQNWRNICSPGRTYYVTDSGTMAGFRLDSSFAAGNGDTTYYSYKILRGLSGQCLDSLYGSVLGNKVIGKTDGRFCFFNRSNDSIWINTYAKLNESWEFYHSSAGVIITAKVEEIKTDTVLGLIDSVKLISLSGSKYGITNIIRLSKHYGLYKTPDFYDLPSIGGLYTLAGKSEPMRGFQQCLRGREIYNFNTGDEFHYYHRKDIAFPRHFDTTEIRKVLAVSWASDSSVVTYMFSRCMHILHFWEYPVDTVYTDTVNWQYSFNPAWDESRLGKMPSEKDNTIGHALYDRKYGSRQGIYFGSIDYLWSDGCWREYGGQMPVSAGYTYSPGLGLTDMWVSAHSQGEWLQLKYFKKGDETWGIPRVVDCNNTGVNDQLQLPRAKVSPNPASDWFSLSISGGDPEASYHYSIADTYGRRVQSGIFKGRTCIFKRSGPGSGLYILLLEDSNGMFLPPLKVVFY